MERVNLIGLLHNRAGREEDKGLTPIVSLAKLLSE
jgi:hypothetical protein